MKSCTFFGHRTVDSNAENRVRTAVRELIEEENVKLFYVGNYGMFDSIVIKILLEFEKEYSITFFVVLPYLPTANKCDEFYRDKTIVPDGIESFPKRIAIIKRNDWMIKKADYVITYVKNAVGSGAARAKNVALSKNKTVIELYK